MHIRRTADFNLSVLLNKIGNPSAVPHKALQTKQGNSLKYFFRPKGKSSFLTSLLLLIGNKGSIPDIPGI
jgi:hypothetical protein